MMTLSVLSNTHRPQNKIQRVGRGRGSKRGKTCCRGAKGDKARCGYKRHFGREGGQLPLYRRLPCRGFSNARFQEGLCAINLSLIDAHFKEGEKVNLETLRQKGLAGRGTKGIKILSQGKLTKKISIEVNSFSKAAQEQLTQLSIPFKTV